MRPSLCLLLLALAAPLGACEDAAETPAPEPARPVRVITASPEMRPVALTYVGVTSSEAILRYGFKVGGRLAKILVKKGDAVSPGQALATLDGVDYSAASEGSRLSVRQAEEARDEARRTLDRVEALAAAGARPQTEAEQARLAFEVRDAQLSQARLKAQVDRRTAQDTTLRAEATGYVLEILSKKGELVGPGQPVVLVRALGQVVKVGVSQADRARVAVGTKARITVDGVEAAGEIRAIDALPDEKSRTWTVEVALTTPLPDETFLIGGVARVAFAIGEHEGFWVPATAVLTEGVSFVFVVDEGRALRKNVTLGELSGALVEVSGLAPGDPVIVEGMKHLDDGARVEVM